MKDEYVLLGPPPVVTIMPTAPTVVREGVLQVIVVLLTTTIVVAFFPSIVTALAPVKSVPVIVTIVPPALVPDDGEILVITGGVT